MIALADCQNFYVSCERVFRPDLRGVPVAVLSNNDGCIIARSEEVKRLGIPMGAPYFKYKKQLERAGVHVFSSNYALYADVSRRVMHVLRSRAATQEVYSIDESFLHLPAADRDELARRAVALRRRVLQWTGIPVRIGIGATKTLAKLANRRARHAPDGVYVMPAGRDGDAFLAAMDAGDVWGIGRARTKRLKRHGVHTARALRDLPDDWVRRHMGTGGLRTVWELRGTSCLPLREAPPARKSVIRSRSFSAPVYDLTSLKEAVAMHAGRAGEKLRAAGLATRDLQVFITTKKYGSGPHHTGTDHTTLPRPENDTRSLIKAAHACLARVYRPNHGYKKAGVALYELTPEEPEQGHLFLPRDPKEKVLMRTVDALNRTMGRGTVAFAASGIKQTWQMNRNLRSPCYTTQWEGLRVVQA